MSITISWIDLISWIFTIVSVVLYILERKKNKPYYMAMQGILKSLVPKSGFYASKYNELKTRDNKAIPKAEYNLLVETIYVDYQSLKELVMGVMKAIEPDKEMTYDTDKFVKKN